MVYDLFAVSNHLGSMAGGHYTSFCRAVPCQADGTDEAASSMPSEGEKPQYRWLHFDDQLVEEVAVSVREGAGEGGVGAQTRPMTLQPPFL